MEPGDKGCCVITIADYLMDAKNKHSQNYLSLRQALIRVIDATIRIRCLHSSS